MNTITAITVICFSPTHTSRKIAEAVAAGMDGIYCGSGEGTGATASCPGTVKTIDLTLDRSEEPVILAQGEAVVIGAPVYAGRVAPEAVKRLKRIQVAAGASVPAVVTVTYGNRDYEDALVELYDLAVSLGLSPFAAGAFIGEPASSEESASGNSKAREHSRLSTSRATGRTKNRPVRRPPMQPHIPPVPVRLPSLQYIPPSLQVQTDLTSLPYP